jgi:hypothetical protein
VLLLQFSQKLPKVRSHPKVENSLNLVTLMDNQEQNLFLRLKDGFRRSEWTRKNQLVSMVLYRLH